MAKINLQNIKKSYGSNTVIHNLSADIVDGELRLQLDIKSKILIKQQL